MSTAFALSASCIFTPAVLQLNDSTSDRSVPSILEDLFADSPDAYHRYPDGSLEIIGQANLDRYIAAGGWRFAEIAVHIAQTQRSDPLLLSVGFDSLNCFEPAAGDIICHGEWTRALDDGCIAIVTERQNSRRLWKLHEAEPSQLGVVVEFRRRVTQRVIAALVDRLTAWKLSIETGKLTGAGHVCGPREVIAAARAVRFRIDVSESGQRAVNWLILSLLRLCESFPIVSISFCEETVRHVTTPRTRAEVVPIDAVLGPFNRSYSLLPMDSHPWA